MASREERRLEMLRRAQQQSLHSSRPYTPLYAVLECLHQYNSGQLDEHTLEDVILQTLSDLQCLNQRLRLPVLDEAQLLLGEDAGLDSEELAKRLELIQAQLLELDLAGQMARWERARLEAHLEQQANQEVAVQELEEGHYHELELWLEDWLDGEVETDSLRRVLAAHVERMQSALEQYESGYLEESEWTLEVALADRLLREGYLYWLEGLRLLQESLEDEQEGLTDDGLSLLLEGNRAFIMVERLAG